VNVGVKASYGEYIVLLNNDTILLPQKDDLWIRMLHAPFSRYDGVGCTGPMVNTLIKNREFVVFFCAMINRTVWDTLEGLNCDFRVGSGEDIDFCYRMSSMGFRVEQVPSKNISIEEGLGVGGFPIYHKGEATVSKIPGWNQIFEENMKRVIDIHSNPKVGIVIPVHNAGTTIAKTLQRIMKQTYNNFEVVVVDDGSTDSSRVIADSFLVKSNSKIKYVISNLFSTGPSEARNVAIDKLTHCDLIAYCDADDWWEPNHLEESVKHLKESGSDIVYSKPICEFEDGTLTQPNWECPEKFDGENLKKQNYIWISSVVHKNLGYCFDKRMDSLEDWDLWLSMYRDGRKFSSKGSSTVHYLVKQNTMASKSNEIFIKFMEKNMDIVPVKLNLGCGDDIMTGWINVDAFSEKASVKANIKELPFPDNYADVILVSHVVEHFKFHEAFDAIKEWRRVLKPDGKLIIETPDFLETCREFVNGDEQWRIRLYGHFFAFPEEPGQTHFFLYTETQLKWTLDQCGLRNINRIAPDSTYSRTLPGKEQIFLRVECTK
jgi:glycosyltransferase involved in cell wall biosynthesis